MSNSSAVEALFFAALEKTSAAERADYLDSACGGDTELRRQVERLLKAHLRLGDFLSRPVVEQLTSALEPADATEAFDPPTAGQGAPPTGRKGPALPRTEGGWLQDEDIAHAFFLPPLEHLGDFRIIREIGHGGMGV